MAANVTSSRIACLGLGSVAAFLCSGAPVAAAEVVLAFRTPSGKIGCVYDSGAGAREVLRCDIRSMLRPKPARPRGCDLDWGDSYVMEARGAVETTCHGDTAILPNARVLAYGSSWLRSGFSCVSRPAGLRCRNRDGHGFFMSRQHSYRF